MQEPSSAKSAPSSGSRGLEMLSLLGRLLVGGPSSRADSSAASSGSERGPSSSEPSQSKQTSLKEAGQMQSLLAGSTMAKLALAGWASGAVTGLLDYLMPGVFSSASSRSFSKRKKPFDPLETFVDTPASLAAHASPQLLRQPAQLAKQPPTPCPSVEEYISPTFARNYQGAWKYVVQIPHEGYFTQTIQRTSCARQRCEFTEGTCHESPRWVSLLVAEIYYPNTVFGAAPSTGQVQPAAEALAASPSAGSIQRANTLARRHPAALESLQVTDSSLGNYNNLYNLNQLGSELSSAWEPQSNLAAYNYQLVQRQGQPALESRSSTQLGPVTQSPQQLVSYSNEYIAALAAAALQQNPNLNINELLTSLQMHYQPGLSRQRRELGAQASAHQRRSQPLSSTTNGLESNGLGQLASPALSHQQAPGYKHTVAADQHQPVDVSAAAPAAAPPAGGDQTSSQQSAGQECDGHDKIGCYVVRVYYDWFLVNGSCKCWKTGLVGNSGSPQSSAGGNSFLRRIFTG